MRKFLTETIHLMFGEASFHKSAGIHTGAGMTLEEYLVSAAGMILAAEEVVEANFI